MNHYYTYQAFLAPDEEGGYDVTVPALPGCYSFGETYAEAAEMAADAVKTYLAVLLLKGDKIPTPTFSEPSGNDQALIVCVQSDDKWCEPSGGLRKN